MFAYQFSSIGLVLAAAAAYFWLQVIIDLM